jgi:2-C-methyl-D-erythritol 4-phosphate cytidylyltransferase
MKYYAVILASGSGNRFNSDIPKQFYKIKNKTILEYSIEAFENNKNIDFIIVVSNPNFMDLTKEIIDKNNYKKVIKLIEGGKTRQESSFNGVFAIEEDEAKVLIHDAVRPFISDEIINDCINSLKEYDAINVAIPCSDTIVEVDEDNVVKKVLNRNSLRRCQTPQCFDLNIIKKAHMLARKDNFSSATDDCSLILKYNLSAIYIVNGSEKNVKITYKSDII